MADHSLMKLGRRAVRKDKRTLMLAKYLVANLPPAPVEKDWSNGFANWGMMLNDRLGDCTIAGCGHAIQTWTNAIGKEITLPDSVILQYYEQWDGYNPSDPYSDQGGVELDVLNAWRKNGLNGHKIDAFVAVDPANIDHVKQAIFMFGGVYIGVSLPISAQSQEVWDVTDVLSNNGAPGSWGGHCVYVVGYDTHGVSLVTWGAVKKATWAFWKTYVDESYALLSPDWISNDISPSGLNLASLQEDLNQLSL